MIKRKQLDLAFKQKYQNKIIHQVGDDFGEIQVIDDGIVRSLHFDSIEKQSAMSLEKPEQLVLSYTQFMMAGFLFNESVKRILCIGLGGGSIPRFFAHFLENCSIDIVELRHLVIDIASNYFFLPSDQRFNYFEGDGARYVKNPEYGTYDMIMVDAFIKTGIAEVVTESAFTEACAEKLNANGIYCINLWSHPPKVYREAMKNISRNFGANVVEIPVKDRTNRIVLGINEAWKRPSIQSLKRRARLLEAAFMLPFSKILEILLRTNRDLFN